ncbi:MAG: TetR/AcrR family transcriptional regulator [Caldilinea sp. CFX5]|nr:TetR/AcrR family transcriptional regulator [Caldilinea sp. CFX5]
MNEAIDLLTPEESAGKSGRKDAVANRRHIIATAQRLFTEHGPAAVNIADIVQAAAIGRGTFYRHFANKGELCLAVMDEQIAEFQNKILALLRRMTADHVSPLTQLDAFLDELVQFTDVDTPLLLEAQRQGVPYFDHKVAPQFWQHATVIGLLRAAVKAGEIAADLDLEYVADAILAPVNAQLFHFQRAERGFSPERISRGLRTIVAHLRIR